MRSFWGLVLLAIGLIFLAINFGWVSADIWRYIWQLWPVLLIAIGLRSLVRSDAAYTLLLLLLILIVAAMVRYLPGRAFMVGGHHFTTHMDRDWHWSVGGTRLSGEQATFTQTQQSDTTIDTVSLDLGGYYDIAVVGGDTNAVSADLKGPKELIEKLALSASGSTLELKDTDMTINWLFNDNQKVTGTITVPKAALLRLKLSGVSTIKATGLIGKVSVNASGASQVTFENSSVIDPEIDLSGAGKVAIDRCQGTSRIDLSGAGEIELKNCSLDKVTVKSSGAGSVDVQGTLKDLDAEVSGAAKVKVPRPTGTTAQDVSGVAKLEYY